MVTKAEFCSIQNINADDIEDWEASLELASKLIKQLPNTSALNANDRLNAFLDSINLLEIRVKSGAYSENNAFVAMLVAKMTLKEYERCFMQWEIKVLQGKMTLGSQPLLASKFMQKLHIGN